MNISCYVQLSRSLLHWFISNPKIPTNMSSLSAFSCSNTVKAPMKLRFPDNEFIALWNIHQVLPTKTYHGSIHKIYSLAKKSARKAQRNVQEPAGPPANDNFVQKDKLDTNLNSTSQNSNPIAYRTAVLQACTITSGVLASLGLIIRQVSHIASMEGLPVLDCSSVVSFDFEMWHLELIIGLVVLISSCRFLLLKTWTDFAESSEAANSQVLTSLQPLDYMAVAFLPGISEELLFRGALLPLLGMNWISIGVVALVFGILHLGSGRKYSFAIWATFVGLAYGYATVLSSSIVVPMVSHAVNNLIGGIFWRYTSNTLE